jgi:uncharacterized protein YbaA (DUF1428 family)
MYVDGFLVPVPRDKREDYGEVAQRASVVFKAHGALSVVEAWGDDVPKGKQTDFYMAVKCTEDENVVFSWITWPDKAARDAGMAKAMADPRLQQDMNAMPFDAKRMVFGGFEAIVEA